MCLSLRKTLFVLLCVAVPGGCVGGGLHGQAAADGTNQGASQTRKFEPGSERRPGPGSRPGPWLDYESRRHSRP